MIVGTVLESLYGTPYAVKAVYMTWWFFLIQALMVGSLIVAVIDRLPFRKRLTGFYIIHASIVTVIAGSVITKVKGLDGQLQLNPGEQSQFVRLNEDVLYISTPFKEFQFLLPSTVREQATSQVLHQSETLKITMKKYYPYADAQVKWIEQDGYHSTHWLLKNDQVAQKVELLFPETNVVPNEAQLGPLKLTYLSENDFIKKTKDEFLGIQVFLKGQSNPFLIPSLPFYGKLEGTEQKLSVELVTLPKVSLRFYKVEMNGQIYKFFPKYSDFPLKDHLEIDSNSPIRLRDQGQNQESKTQVLITRSEDKKIKIGFQNKGKWQILRYQGSPVALPWMGLQLSLLKEAEKTKPELEFAKGKPQKDDEKNTQAAFIEIQLKQGNSTIEKSFWVSDASKQMTTLGDLQIHAFVGKKLEKLPFWLSLDNFKMETNPGTQEAASYESFVKVEGDSEIAHIYMNHPLKKQGYTFYQSSYFQDENGEYHSILSVNQDPGRVWKYIGSLVLVLGLIIHYLIYYRIVRFSSDKAPRG